MIQTATHNFATLRGNTLPIVLRLPIDVEGWGFIFRAKWADGSLQKTSSAGEIVMTDIGDPDHPKWELSLKLSPAETRALPLGAATAFEYEMRPVGGDQYTFLEGKIAVRGGLNDD